MQTVLRLFLALYLAQLLADFVFQTRRQVEQKRRGKPGAYLLHGITHYLCAILLAGFFVPGSLPSVRVQSVIVALALVHLLIDFGKVQVDKAQVARDKLWAFLLDQFLHFVTVAFAAWLISPPSPPGEISAWIQRGRAMHGSFLALPVIYVGVVFGGGYLIRFLIRSLAESVPSDAEEKSREQLQNAGLYIGWLERFLVVTAILLHSPATVGLILTAKSIARYPEFKSKRFAEYFLIGTLLSLSIAIVGGAILAKLLFGHTALPE
jgi:hypothetical protein